MFKFSKSLLSLSVCSSALALSSTAMASNYYLKQVSTGKYATIDSSSDRIKLTASSSGAQVFTKVASGSGYKIQATSGSYAGLYSDEPSGGNRQEVSASSSSAEIFSDSDCGDGGVYIKSLTTGKNMKVESDAALGNGSSGNCNSSANKFEWVAAPSSGGGFAVPGTIQAEEYEAFYDTTSGNAGNAYRSDNVDIQATSDSGGGYNVGWMKAGEWLEYTIDVASSGTYSLDARVASLRSSGALSISINGNVVGSASVGYTGGWQSWTDKTIDLGSLSAGTHTLRVNVTGNDFNLNWLKLSSSGNNSSDAALNPNAAPDANFDLSTWNLGVPIDRGDGISTTISVEDLNNAYEHNDYFFTADDGGMVFRCPIEGPKTSENTSYTRSELREMLRGTDTSISTKGVNENNWVFSGTSIDAQLDAGGVNGNMKATLKVDYVTTTGNTSQQGRVIIGQIHAPSNEPIRLYYRKLAHHTKGSIYFAHEPASGYGSEVWVEMIGSKSSSASEPSDGIELGEVFSYEIDVTDDALKVVIKRDGKDDVTETLDISGSGYDEDDKYQYFKAGVYNQNNTGDADDYVQATFYSLEKSHD
ncbi:MAG: polysaccharide lyase family 7 protein [Acidiferrobacterales bacterium]|nr:polysaccharide lyase family 7 protein [Acidiferrobacterales bacterium]